MTLTVIDWIDLFTRVNQRLIIVDSLRYCINNKGLEVYGWCLMGSHLHLMAGAKEGHHLADTMRDFKKYTSRKLVEQIIEEPESRKEWLLSKMQFAAMKHPKNEFYKVWQDGNHAIAIYSEKFAWQKLNYIHWNPVVDMLVDKPEDYLFSSARNYTDRSTLLPVILLTPPVLTSDKSGFFRVNHE